jgi:hypothetical protein
MHIVSVNVSNTNIINTDTDVNIKFDRAEIDTITNEVTRLAIGALCLQIPVVGPIVAVYVNERIDQIARESGPNGCVLEITIRNGTELRVFSVHAE